jgi:hypothetical protein
MYKTINNTLLNLVISVSLICGASNAIAGDPIPGGWLAHNMEPIGFLDYQDRYAGKFTIKEHEGRWYIYTAVAKTQEGHGPRQPPILRIIDVTDPTDPTVVRDIVYPMDGNMSQITSQGDLLMVGLARELTLFDTRNAINFMSEFQPEEIPEDKLRYEGVIFFDISDPLNPVELSHWETGAYGVHRNILKDGFAYLSASAPGYRAQIFKILDVRDPKNPVELGQWAQHGQKFGEVREDGLIPSFHGPAIISPDNNTAILGFTPDMVTLDISDKNNPTTVGRLQIIPPFVNNVTQAVHTVIPYWDSGLVYLNGEPKIPQCGEAIAANVMIDNRNPEKPFMMSYFPIPEVPEGYPWKNFCDRPGRFGPHNANNEIHNQDVMQPNDLIHLAYFNAGIRVYDIAEPRLPKEVGWFIPGDPETPKRSQSGYLPISITQEVLIDTRGNIFTSGATGMYVLRNSGDIADRW